MIRRSAAIATAAVLLSLLVHVLGLGLTSPSQTDPTAEQSATDVVALGNAFEDVAEAVSEPVAPEPDPVDASTSEALVASPTPEQVFAPEGSPGEIAEPVAPPPAPQPDATTDPQQRAALAAPADPVAPVEREAIDPETPALTVEPDPPNPEEVRSETDSSDLAVVASPRPRRPDRQPVAQTAPQNDNSTEFGELLSPPLIESPLAAHLRGEAELVVRQEGGSGFLESGGSGNSDVTNYAGRVLVHLNRSLTVRATAHGAAWVHFVINPDGTLAQVGIVDSTGSQEIEQAAMKQVRDAAPFPRPPKGISRQLTFVYRNK